MTVASKSRIINYWVLSKAGPPLAGVLNQSIVIESREIRSR
jgi:hypothetical protein